MLWTTDANLAHTAYQNHHDMLKYLTILFGLAYTLNKAEKYTIHFLFYILSLPLSHHSEIWKFLGQNLNL